MKRILLLSCTALLLQGCAALQAYSERSASQNTPDSNQETKAARFQQGNQLQTTEQYPAVVVTPSGGHAVVMPPCGNTSVVVNPDGSHSIAVIVGSTATIVTP